MGIKLFNSTIKLMQQRSSETLQLVKCVVKDVNFNVRKSSYGYKILQLHKLCNFRKGNVKQYS